MFRIQKSFTFEAAHQLETAVTAACHECVHGHSYTAELHLAAMVLNKDQMVLDFTELAAFKARIMALWDHGLLLHVDKHPHFQPLIDKGVLKASKVFFFSENPTAETMAKFLFRDLQEFIRRLGATNVVVESVRVHETATGWAEFSGAL